MEFKDHNHAYLHRIPVGLIESDWNLKENMESQQRAEKAGLIESDWNLKVSDRLLAHMPDSWINRIRLEFKANVPSHPFRRS